ncbi:DUF3617 domain-containing protein [Sphingosinicella microcystinivorans]|uniref:DUF3617 domain-containing protein n=1 Tax=Sphingosinicella microcystinivorans TaxID=335406 RepID=UPI0022F3D4CA|nr:DUF3617 family protein [Sphingosinicella microcystinivorans]WBX83468.1 DUF3617 family protein [Sphingosinicella microcystinivorans]
MKRVLAGACIALIATSAVAAPKTTTTTTKTAAPAKTLWVTTGSVVSVSGTGLSAADIKTIKNRKLSGSTCMAREPSAADIQTAIGNTFGSCTFSKFGLAASTIRAVMQCNGAYGPMTADFLGSRGATTYSGSTSAIFAGSKGQVYVKSVISGKISGNC